MARRVTERDLSSCGMFVEKDADAGQDGRYPPRADRRIAGVREVVPNLQPGLDFCAHRFVVGAVGLEPVVDEGQLERVPVRVVYGCTDALGDRAQARREPV